MNTHSGLLIVLFHRCLYPDCTQWHSLNPFSAKVFISLMQFSLKTTPLPPTPHPHARTHLRMHAHTYKGVQQDRYRPWIFFKEKRKEKKVICFDYVCVSSLSFWDGGGEGMVYLCLGAGGVKVCVIAKLSVRKYASYYNYKVFWVLSCKYTFRVLKFLYLFRCNLLTYAVIVLIVRSVCEKSLNEKETGRRI